MRLRLPSDGMVHQPAPMFLIDSMLRLSRRTPLLLLPILNTGQTSEVRVLRPKHRTFAAR